MLQLSKWFLINDKGGGKNTFRGEELKGYGSAAGLSSMAGEMVLASTNHGDTDLSPYLIHAK